VRDKSRNADALAHASRTRFNVRASLRRTLAHKSSIRHK